MGRLNALPAPPLVLSEPQAVEGLLAPQPFAAGLEGRRNLPPTPTLPDSSEKGPES